MCTESEVKQDFIFLLSDLAFIVLCAEQVARIWREAWQGLHFC